MQITVNLRERSYPIFVENGISADVARRLREQFPKSRFAIVTNVTLAALYRETLSAWSEMLGAVIHEMPDGERYKTIESWCGILDVLLREKLERSSVIIAFGGGVVGDVTGFAAAAFLRGVAFVQIPTTLLAMVDSSVGGKTAVDHPLGKNLIGAFHQPRAVFVDTAFLATLSDREFASGYAELFKYSFIGGKDMFDFVVGNHEAIVRREPAALLEGVERSIAIKANVVEQDEQETSGLRAQLNFGHTFAHALERFFHFGDILHGEAVWWGMLCAIDCSRRTGTINCEATAEYERIEKLILRPSLPRKVDVEAVYDMMFTDKKVADGKLRLVLPTRPGTSTVRGDIPAGMVKASIVSVLG